MALQTSDIGAQAGVGDIWVSAKNEVNTNLPYCSTENIHSFWSLLSIFTCLNLDVFRIVKYKVFILQVGGIITAD